MQKSSQAAIHAEIANTNIRTKMIGRGYLFFSGLKTVGIEKFAIIWSSCRSEGRLV